MSIRARKRRPIVPATLAPAAPALALHHPPSLTGGLPSEPMRQAHRDLERGLKHTDRGAEADRSHAKLQR